MFTELIYLNKNDDVDGDHRDDVDDDDDGSAAAPAAAFSATV